jgi:FkbM family methyltransferase
MALLALLCPEVRQVVLFEPNPDALMVASENLIRNKLSARARFVCAFVSAGSGDTARLWTVGSGAAGSVYASHAATASRGGHSIDVPTATLDEVSDAYGVVPELVKVDVEGAESQVLEGARRLASHNRSRFLVEVHSNPDLTITANTAAILSWCEGRDYAAWYLARHARLTDPEQVRDRGRCHVLLQPSAWPYPPWLVGIQQSAALPEILPVPRAER